MRFSTVGLVLAGLVVAGSASAAGGVGGKGDTGGKGGNGPTSGANVGSADEGPGTDTSLVSQKNPDKRQTIEEEKPWEVGGTWETHRMFYQEDTNNSSSKVFNVLFFFASYNLTDKDRLSAGWGLSQSYFADPGETGWRGSDVSLAYTRSQPLGNKFTLRGSLSATLPTSYQSQIQSLITAPGATIGLSKKLGDLTLDARITGGAFIVKYREMSTGYSDNNAGGVPNPKYRFGGAITAEYAMPFHRALSVGAALTDSYIWFYDVNGGTSANFQGVVSDAQYQNQPMLQSYGGEIFARYQLPTLYGFKADATVSVANGDPSLGSLGVLHGTGVVHPYLMFRDTGEVYATMSLRY